MLAMKFGDATRIDSLATIHASSVLTVITVLTELSNIPTNGGFTWLLRLLRPTLGTAYSGGEGPGETCPTALSLVYTLHSFKTYNNYNLITDHFQPYQTGQ